MLPGVYVLSTSGPLDPAELPKRIGPIGFAEYHPPPADTVPLAAVPLFPSSLVAGRDAELRARIVDVTAPDSAVLFLRRRAEPSWRGYPMRPAGGYEYAAAVPASELQEGPHELLVTVYRGDSSATFPGGGRQQPTDWNFAAGEAWPLDVADPRSPVSCSIPAPTPNGWRSPASATPAGEGSSGWGSRASPAVRCSTSRCRSTAADGVRRTTPPPW